MREMRRFERPFVQNHFCQTFRAAKRAIAAHGVLCGEASLCLGAVRNHHFPILPARFVCTPDCLRKPFYGTLGTASTRRFPRKMREVNCPAGKFRIQQDNGMKMTAKALLMGALTAGLCCGLMAGVTGKAYAQDEEGDEAESIEARPIKLRVIGSYLANSSVADFLGKPVLGVGAAYDFKRIDSALPIHLAGTLDFFNKSRTKNGTKVEGSYYGVGVSGRIYFLPEEARLNFYGGGGLALNFPRYKVEVRGTEISSDSTVALGARLFSGLEFDRSFFGEFEYAWPGKSELNAFNAAIGYRF